MQKPPHVNQLLAGTLRKSGIVMARTSKKATQESQVHTREALLELTGVDETRLAAFERLIRAKGAELYRDLPWRNTRDPYEIWLSEVMLQQTQVARVITKWTAWLERFPTVDALALASTAEVLEEWQGLGYNRRALALKRAAEEVSGSYGGVFPREVPTLIGLPGIGPATAAGIRAFAFDLPGIYLETNVRTVILHEFFPNEDQVSDKVVAPLVELTCPASDVRGWYYAMLDYGAHLKATIPNPSRRSKHHVKQSKFEGSHRQKRAFLLREVLGAAQGVDTHELQEALNREETRAGRDRVEHETVVQIVDELCREGFIKRVNARYYP